MSDLLDNDFVKSKTFKNPFAGILLWLLSCFLGSIVMVEMERYLLNQRPGFYMSLPEGVSLWIIFSLISAIASAVFILLIYLLAKRAWKLGNAITLSFIVAFFIFWFVVWELSANLFEGFYIILPYFVFATIFSIYFVRSERR